VQNVLSYARRNANRNCGTTEIQLDLATRTSQGNDNVNGGYN